MRHLAGHRECVFAVSGALFLPGVYLLLTSSILVFAVRLQIHVAATGLLSYLVGDQANAFKLELPVCLDRLEALLRLNLPCPFHVLIKELATESQVAYLLPVITAGRKTSV